MENIKSQYVVDAQGHPKAVLLTLKDYKKVMRLLEDIRDRAYIRRHQHEKLIPMQVVHRNLKKEGLV